MFSPATGFYATFVRQSFNRQGSRGCHLCQLWEKCPRLNHPAYYQPIDNILGQSNRRQMTNDFNLSRKISNIWHEYREFSTPTYVASTYTIIHVHAGEFWNNDASRSSGHHCWGDATGRPIAWSLDGRRSYALVGASRQRGPGCSFPFSIRRHLQLRKARVFCVSLGPRWLSLIWRK